MVLDSDEQEKAEERGKNCDHNPGWQVIAAAKGLQVSFRLLDGAQQVCHGFEHRTISFLDSLGTSQEGLGLLRVGLFACYLSGDAR